MKIIVAGPRAENLTDQALASLAVHMRFEQLPPDTIIVHGASPGGGIDEYADQAAECFDLKTVRVPITYEDRRRARAMSRPRFAPIARTIRMFDEHPDAELVLVWTDGDTPGTKFTLQEAKRRNVPIELREL